MTWEKKENADEKIQHPLWRQGYVCFGLSIMAISYGMAEGFSAILLPQLEASGKWTIDDKISSWITSITVLPPPLGCILGGVLMESIGRKYLSVLSSLTCILGWLMIYWAYSMPLLLMGRLTTGLCLGLMGPCAGVYIAETSDPKLRGFLMATLSFAVSLGLFLSHTIGSYIHWRNTALISSVISTASLILIFAPESPTYLIKIGKIQEAIKTFYCCRGKNEVSELELMELIQRQKQILKKGNGFDVKRKMLEVLKPEFYKPMMVMTVFFFTSQWFGHTAITFYSLLIIRKTIGSGLNNFLAMFVLDVLRLVMSILACFANRIFSRRIMVLTTGFGMVLCLLFVSLFTFLSRSCSVLRDSYSYLPLIGLVGYISLAIVGFLPASFVVLGEIFPQSSRGLGCGTSMFFNNVLLFTAVKSFPFIISKLGTDGTFLVYGLTGLIGTFVLLVILPETKDKPLHEIENYFKKDRGVECKNTKVVNNMMVVKCIKLKGTL